MTALKHDINSVFMPRAMEHLARLKQPGTAGFVHYTSAATMISILRDRKIWMRNARCMNDVSEMQHGCDRLMSALGNDCRREKLINALNLCRPDAAEKAFALFDQYRPNILDRTFITCLSEHDQREDKLGRLSMWRAYGQDSVGVALVINKEVLFLEGNALNAFSSPVAYLTDEELLSDIDRIIANVAANEDWLKKVDPIHLQRTLFATLLFGVTSLKHPGFWEEREWRVIHSPDIFPSPVLKQSIEIIGGVPQQIFKIPLEDFAVHRNVGFSPDKIISRLIIGPSNYPGQVKEAMVDALTAAGVKNAADRVVMSDIPLRMHA